MNKVERASLQVIIKCGEPKLNQVGISLYKLDREALHCIDSQCLQLQSADNGRQYENFDTEEFVLMFLFIEYIFKKVLCQNKVVKQEAITLFYSNIIHI